jgi:hypothetical protein
MNMKRLTQQVASAALLFVAALSPIAACAEEIYDSRPVIVRPAPRGLRECPTCYKGHDFGRDCFQNVWNGFDEVWTKVCRLGWH